MFCKHCGEKVDDDSKFCRHCGLGVNADSENTKKSESKGKEIEHKDDEPDLGNWSWGGAGITFLYAIAMKFKWWVVLLILLFNLTTRGLDSSEETIWVAVVMYFVLFFYFGLNSRKWAWKTRKWKDLEQFQKTQRVWDIWGIVVFILTFGLSFMVGFLEGLAEI